MISSLESATRCLNRRLMVPVKWILTAAAVVPLAALYVIAATDDDENVALARNEVMDDGAGGRVWHGAMVNTANPVSPGVFREVAVTIRFLDGNGQPVGETRGRADQLEPGQAITLEAPLPPEAASIQMYSLQWRTGQRRVVGRLLGPWPSWPFGYLQYDPSG